MLIFSPGSQRLIYILHWKLPRSCRISGVSALHSCSHPGHCYSRWLLWGSWRCLSVQCSYLELLLLLLLTTALVVFLVSRVSWLCNAIMAELRYFPISHGVQQYAFFIDARLESLTVMFKLGTHITSVKHCRLLRFPPNISPQCNIDEKLVLETAKLMKSHGLLVSSLYNWFIPI